MEAINRLEQLGYTFVTDGANIHYQCSASPNNSETIRALLAIVRSNKAQALAYLTTRLAPQSTRPADANWKDTRVRIEEFSAFKARHGLQVVSIEWPKGAATPIAYLTTAASSLSGSHQG